MGKTNRIQGSFANEVNVDYIMSVLCDILTRNSGGEIEYTYKISPKKGKGVNNVNKGKEETGDGKETTA